MLTQEEVDSLSLQQLTNLEAMISCAKEKAQEAAKAELLAEMERMAQAVGLSVEEVMEVKYHRPPLRKVAPKYIHPTDPSLTWAGRGQRPKWLVAYLESGGEMDDCAV